MDLPGKIMTADYCMNVGSGKCLWLIMQGWTFYQGYTLQVMLKRENLAANFNKDRLDSQL